MSGTATTMDAASASTRSAQTDRLIAAIARQFPVAGPLVWGWVGLEDFSGTAETLVLFADRLAARHQGRVLLADADTQRKSLTRRLELRSQAGLSDLLASNAGRHECRTAASDDGPWLMPAGLTRIKRQSLANVPERLERLRAEYRFSIFDLGAGRSPLAAELARRCDAVYCFVRLGLSPRAELQQRCRQLQADGVPLHGCVVL